MTEIVNGKAILEDLAKPFNPQDIEWRVQSATRKDNVIKLLVLPYIESRAVMNRLDLVCGANWQSQFDKIVVAEKEAFQCRLSIKIGDEWITRTDGAEVGDIESVKGGHSNALKRAAVQWGIGRYLYDCPQYWVELKQRGEHRVWGKFKIHGQMEQLQGYFDTPNLPNWALPEGTKSSTNNPVQKPKQAEKQKPSKQSNQQPSGNQEHEEALKYVNNILSALDVPTKYIQPLLKRASGSTVPLAEASVEDLRKLFKALLPCFTFVKGCRELKIGTSEMLYYAQIVLKVELENIHSIYFKMGKKEAEEALELAKSEHKKAV